MRPSQIAIIGAPMDLGAGRRGVDMGPSALRVANLNSSIAALGYEVKDYGNVTVPQPEALSSGPSQARYLPEIVDTCTQLAALVHAARKEGRTPLVLGGDHSIAIGTIAGMARYYREQDHKLGLIWIDAHADMNTPETSPSGNIHGMPLACCVGQGPGELVNLAGFAPMIDPRRVALVGLRNVDKAEKKHVAKSGIRAFTMRDIDERGLRIVLEEAVEVVTEGTAGFHVSLDMDAVDPREAPGVGTPVRGGLTYREAHLAMEILCDAGAMSSMEIVEVNPVIDEANRTAIFGVELVMSALGKRIL
jgi:arginase